MSFSGFDDRPNNIEEVLAKMNDFEAFLKKEEKESFLPFLRAYKIITEKVIEGKDKGLFDNPEELEELDMFFAELYFNAMKTYFNKGEKETPWKTYLEYMERDDSRPLIELLLGINAHINADLAQTMQELGYDREKDFRKINIILLESLNPVLLDTAFTRMDLEAFALYGAQPISNIGLRKITSWRQDAWSRKNEDIETIRDITELKAEELVRIRHNKSVKGLIQKPVKILRA